MFKQAQQQDNLIRREERFSLRKFKNGLASVTVGAALFFAVDNAVLTSNLTVNRVHAEEVGQGAVEETTDPAAAQEESAQVLDVAEELEFKPETLVNSGAWESEKMLYDSSVVEPADMGYASTQASTEIAFEDKTVTVTATIESTNGNPQGTSQFLGSSNQSRYAASNDQLVGEADPADIPTLDIYVPARKLQPGENQYDKLNLNGEYESAILTFTFSEEVIDPVIDLSGLGGNTHNGSRGSFNATKLEVLTPDVNLVKGEGAVNLQVEDNIIQVEERNAYTHATAPEYITYYDRDRLGRITDIYRTPKLAPAGTGSILVQGKFTELSFKLYHQTTPFSAFSKEEYGTSDRFFTTRYPYYDGVNGLDANYFDHGKYYLEVVDGGPSVNGDLFRLSFRLQSGKVLVDYVDTEGVSLKEQFVDTPTTNVGTAYDTQENAEEYPEQLTAKGATYYLVPEGDYGVGQVAADGHLTDTTTDYGTDAVAGTVIPGEKKITYVYQKGGDVLVHYVINGTDTPLAGAASGIAKTSVASTERDMPAFSKPGTPYDTADLKPTEITADGKLYRLVEAATDESKGARAGLVKADATLEVTYKYEEVLGSVTVEYLSEAGEELIAKADVKRDVSLNQTYETTYPEEIEKDGRLFRFTRHDDSSAPASGDVKEEEQHVIYRYKEVTGSVTVEYLTEDGEVLIGKSDVVRDGSLNETYTTDYPEEIVTEDGRTFRYTRVDDAFDTPSGEVEEGEKHVVYRYEEVKGDVVVNYVDTNGNVIKLPVVDTPESSTGKGYDTTDNKPNEIKTDDGKVYRLVPALTQGDETGQVVKGTVEITYVYEEVTGSVTVEYLAEDGEVLIAKTDVKRDASLNDTYETTYPEEIVTEDGRTFRYTRVDDDFDATSGDVQEGEKHVVYRYEEVKGDVLVNYVDTNGNVIKLPVVDTPDSSTGTGYDTTDNKPSEITTEDGKVYRIVPTLTKGDEKGDVVVGTTEITYVYEEVTGSVTVEYLTEDGEVLMAKADVKRDVSLNEIYETTYPEEIVTEDGRTFRYTRVDDAFDAPLGNVEEGEKHVVYRYEEVKGDVVVNYMDTDGNVIKLPVVDMPESSTGTDYDTTDNKPNEIKTDEGKVYRLVPALTQGDETGQVVKGTTEITYVYEEVLGSVTVEYLTEDGEVLIGKSDVVRDGSLNETYTTDYPEEIVTEDGRTYRYTRVDDAFDAPSGDVEEGEKHVVYRYEEVKGDVVINYVDKDGNVIKSPVVDTPDSSTGKGYDTTDNKPSEITTDDGKVYRLLPSLTKGNENGQVVIGTTEITYVYEEVLGSVTVEYLTEDGEVLIAKSDVKRDASLNETYETDYPEEIVTENGRTFRYTRVDDAFDTPSGDVEEDEKHVVYRYEEVKGDVIVNYVDTDGNVIKLSVVDTPESSTGKGYDTTDNKPSEITTEDGKVYRLVPALIQGDETGQVVKGTTEITYVYEEILGSVTVEYLTEDGEVLIAKSDVKRDASLNETYETDYPEEIVTENGRTFRYTRVDDAFDKPSGDVEEGENHVVYRYEEVKGDVVVNYVDTAGNVIKLPVVDTPTSSTGTSYDTTDNKPSEITTEDGKVYRLVPSLTQGDETGQVVKGTTEITYVYEEVITPTSEESSETSSEADSDQESEVVSEVETSNSETTSEPVSDLVSEPASDEDDASTSETIESSTSEQTSETSSEVDSNQETEVVSEVEASNSETTSDVISEPVSETASDENGDSVSETIDTSASEQTSEMSSEADSDQESETISEEEETSTSEKISEAISAPDSEPASDENGDSVSEIIDTSASEQSSEMSSEAASDQESETVSEIETSSSETISEAISAPVSETASDENGDSVSETIDTSASEQTSEMSSEAASDQESEVVSEVETSNSETTSEGISEPVSEYASDEVGASVSETIDTSASEQSSEMSSEVAGDQESEVVSEVETSNSETTSEVISEPFSETASDEVGASVSETIDTSVSEQSSELPLEADSGQESETVSEVETSTSETTSDVISEPFSETASDEVGDSVSETIDTSASEQTGEMSSEADSDQGSETVSEIEISISETSSESVSSPVSETASDEVGDSVSESIEVISEEQTSEMLSDAHNNPDSEAVSEMVTDADTEETSRSDSVQPGQVSSEDMSEGDSFSESNSQAIPEDAQVPGVEPLDDGGQEQEIDQSIPGLTSERASESVDEQISETGAEEISEPVDESLAENQAVIGRRGMPDEDAPVLSWDEPSQAESQVDGLTVPAQKPEQLVKRVANSGSIQPTASRKEAATGRSSLQLPNTGEHSSSALLTGLGLLLTTAALVGKRRRKEK